MTYQDGGTGDAGDQYTGLDRFGRLVETLWKTGSADQVRSKYGRNRFGGVVWRRDDEAHAQSPGVDTEDNYYGYDGLYQVKERQRGDLTGAPPDYTGITNLQQEEDWTYDATGNWSAYDNTNPANSQTRTHNVANEITETSASPGDFTPTYDPVGNMTTLPQTPGTSTDEYDLTWDAWNRLIAVKDGSTVVASYHYDGLTRRLTKTTAVETRHYYHNTDWRALEDRVEGATITVDRQYTWSLQARWDLLRRKRSTTGSLDETLFLLRDYLDPVAVVGADGLVLERYAYDAFGNVRFLAPDYSDRSGSDFDWEFLFHAEFRDTDTKLYHYGYRYYDTRLGSWLSRNPIGEKGRMSFYAFAINDAVSLVDIPGLDSRESISDYVERFLQVNPQLTPAQQKWVRQTANQGCIGITKCYVGRNNPFDGSVCYRRKEEAETRAKNMKESGCKCPTIFSLHFYPLLDGKRLFKMEIDSDNVQTVNINAWLGRTLLNAPVLPPGGKVPTMIFR